MAQTLKSLAQADLTATTLTDIYTVPASTSAIARVTLCNRSGSAVAVRLAHAPAGASDALPHYKLYDFSIPANDSWTTPYTIEMATTDKLRAKAGTADTISVTVCGIEVT
jgi:hypothetical protein